MGRLGEEVWRREVLSDNSNVAYLLKVSLKLIASCQISSFRPSISTDGPELQQQQSITSHSHCLM